MGSRASHRVIAYDRRGFARSSAAPRGVLADQARDAAELLEALGASPATVVGWSAGGVIALDLAASYPERVASLVLAEPAVHLFTHPTQPPRSGCRPASASRDTCGAIRPRPH